MGRIMRVGAWLGAGGEVRVGKEVEVEEVEVEEEEKGEARKEWRERVK